MKMVSQSLMCEPSVAPVRAPKLRRVKASRSAKKVTASNLCLRSHANVRIQSGFWSFYFEHHEGQDGLGMITPLEIPPESLPEGITTRITLTFIQEPANIFTQLVEEMEALPDTVTVFLQTIKELEFIVTKPDSQRVSTTIRADVKAVYPNGRRSVVTTKTTRQHQASKTVITNQVQQHYTVSTMLLHGMPVDKRPKWH